MAGRPSAQFSMTVQVEIEQRPGMLGRLTTAIGDAGGDIGSVTIVEPHQARLVRAITIDCSDEVHARSILGVIEGIDGIGLLDSIDRTFEMHRGGKIYTGLTSALKDSEDLSMAYTPGVARVCLEIAGDRDKAFDFTIKRNTVAVVSDGSAVLGLGDIGPEASMPVMEGKAMLFKEFGGVDAFPIVLDTQDVDEIVATVTNIAPTFGGINLEDISSPRCFDIEDRLIAALDIPVFHDDQHGTAIVTLAALLNACRLTGRPLDSIRAVMAGAGAAGVAVSRLLLKAGLTDIVACDRAGAIHSERDDYEGMNRVKRWLAENTNRDGRSGTIAEMLEGSDLFIGLSGPGIIEAPDLARMNSEPFVFAMANPTPEISPEDAGPYVRVMATGRSDYPNQINNVLAFPGIFRGALDVRARDITDDMKIAAAEGIASAVSDDELTEDYIMPSVFNRAVPILVARAVADRATQEGVAREGESDSSPEERAGTPAELTGVPGGGHV